MLRGLLVAALVLAGAGKATAQASIIRYIAFGDSITEGFGDSSDREEPGYPARLQQLLVGVEVINEGQGGENTSEALTRIDEVLFQGGDFFLLMEGTNDISGEIPIETTLFNLGEMADRAEAAGFEVVHATLIPRPPYARVDPNDHTNRELNQRLRQLAGEEDRQLVDNYEVFFSRENRFDTLYFKGEDRTGHPNEQGYDLMAETFRAVLEGEDQVPPVVSRVLPRDGRMQVSPNAAVVVDVWDFGDGIDREDTGLRINGRLVDVVQSGNDRQLTLHYAPEDAFTGAVTVDLVARDQAQPFNEVDREITRFVIAGTQFLDGDIDQDGRVDGRDLVLFSLRFGARRGATRYSSTADFNGDGEVDGEDLAVLASNFGSSIE